MDKFGETFMYSMSPVLVHIVYTQVTECFLMTCIINVICNFYCIVTIVSFAK